MGDLISYVCSACGAADVKLWRDYNTLLDHIKLKCAACCTKPPEVSFDFDEGDQIGWMVPAVPTEEMDTFWGYTSVPADRVLWWYGLRTYATDDALELQITRKLMLRWRQSLDSMAEAWLSATRKNSELHRKLEEVSREG